MSSMANSDHDMSESDSMQSYSPYSSPSQQVPQLTTDLTELTCADSKVFHFLNKGHPPFLRIVEQPQNHFRFRYVSEMVGTHGCLLGKTSSSSKSKTHPTVELCNYSGKAKIRCRLAQINNTEEHPHKLLEDEQDREVSYTVPEHDSYKVGFAGMGIIHTAKKDIPTLLFKKFTENGTPHNMTTKELRTRCENIAKAINLNIVRLKFSAHDDETGKDICEPVYSEPIHNMKSAATNDLKICRMSRITGRPRGGDDVFIFVEKVNKKNIVINFFELDENGQRRWSEKANFIQNDVHHQYAIVFRTPQYANPQTPTDVKVYVELVRPSDGRTSEPKDFTYKAEEVFKQIKKRKANSSYSSIGSSSSGSLKSLSELPTPLFNINQMDLKNECEMPQYNIQQLPVTIASPTGQCDLANALSMVGPSLAQPPPNPMWCHPNDSIPNLTLDSTEIEELLSKDNDMTPEDRKLVREADWTAYVSSFPSFNDIQTENPNSMEFIRTTLISDSGRGKPKQEPKFSPKEEIEMDIKDFKDNTDQPAVFKKQDGAEVKSLVVELCGMIKNKNGYKKQVVRSKLERLFDIRLSNGDTFLHMALSGNQPSFEYIVKMIHNVKMSHLLDCTNNRQQTALHLAIAYDMPKIVSLLVAKGCNPMMKDAEEENAIHYAAKHGFCLDILLDTIKSIGMICDLNEYNIDKHTPLHVATLHKRADTAATLLQHGASAAARDAHLRTPLHHAALDDCVHVMRALLHHTPPSEIDVLDGNENTALQIVCGGGSIRSNSLEMAKLLLDKKADPLARRDYNESAWALCRDKPELRELLKQYLPADYICYDDDIKSEPEDEFESAEEDEAGGLAELPRYVREVARLVDDAGAWRRLAERLGLDAMCAHYAAQPSPARAVLDNLKEYSEDVTSKSLALILDDMGQTEAANVIRRYID